MRGLRFLKITFCAFAVAMAGVDSALPKAAVELMCDGSVLAISSDELGEVLNNNVSFAEDRFGNVNAACYFNGLDAFVEIPDADVFSISTTGALTVSAWVSPETLNFENNDNGYVHWMGKGMPQQHEWALRMYNRDLVEGQEQRPNRISSYAFNLSGGLGSGSYVQEKIAANEWIHVVARYDMESNSISIYKNGVLKDTDTLTDDTYNVHPENGTAPVRIGTRSKWSFFKGRIDDVRFYDYALSESEILALFSEMCKACGADSSGPTAIHKRVYVQSVSKPAPNIYRVKKKNFLVDGRVER